MRLPCSLSVHIILPFSYFLCGRVISEKVGDYFFPELIVIYSNQFSVVTKHRRTITELGR
jgi:hypothetical protein